MKIVITKKARKQLDKIPANIQEKIISKVLALKDQPIGAQSKKLTNQPGYRLKIGDYRVLYLIDFELNKIIVSRIKHRKDVYRNL